MYQSYINEDGVIITSKSDEATINGWCQEIKIEELRQILEAKKKEKSFWNKIKNLFKGGKNKCQK